MQEDKRNTYNNLILGFKGLSVQLKTLIDAGEDLPITEVVLIAQELEGLVQLLDDPIISAPLDNFNLSQVSKIDLLNLGKDVLGLYKTGSSLSQIAKTCSQQVGQPINKKEVQQWIDEFDQRSVSGKQRIVYGSIFDTTDRLEEIYISIMKLSETVKARDENYYKSAKVVREQVELEVMRELRQLVSEADKLASKIRMAEDMRRFTSLVIECLKKEAPMVYTRVLKLLREEQAAFRQLTSS